MIQSLKNRAGMIRDAIQQRLFIHGSYVRVFDSPDGEAVLQHIMKQGYVTRSTFVEGDPQQTALNEGSRRLALSILKFAKKDHQQLIKQIEQGITDE